MRRRAPVFYVAAPKRVASGVAPYSFLVMSLIASVIPGRLWYFVSRVISKNLCHITVYWQYYKSIYLHSISFACIVVLPSDYGARLHNAHLILNDICVAEEIWTFLTICLYQTDFFWFVESAHIIRGYINAWIGVIVEHTRAKRQSSPRNSHEVDLWNWDVKRNTMCMKFYNKKYPNILYRY